MTDTSPLPDATIANNDCANLYSNGLFFLWPTGNDYPAIARSTSDPNYNNLSVCSATSPTAGVFFDPNASAFYEQDGYLAVRTAKSWSGTADLSITICDRDNGTSDTSNFTVNVVKPKPAKIRVLASYYSKKYDAIIRPIRVKNPNKDAIHFFYSLTRSGDALGADTLLRAGQVKVFHRGTYANTIFVRDREIDIGDDSAGIYPAGLTQYHVRKLCLTGSCHRQTRHR